MGIRLPGTNSIFLSVFTWTPFDRHSKPTQQNPQGGIIEKEAPINVSNVMLLDPKTNEPTRLGSKLLIDEKTGKKKHARVSKVSGEMIQ